METLKPLPENDEIYIARAVLRQYTGIAANTWAAWAVIGRGPKPVRLGRRAMYKVGDLRRFLSEAAA